MAQLPDGVVTFLFSDIEGSTRLLQQNAEVLRAGPLRHNTLLSAAIVSNHGHVFETVGDAYYAVFARATDAVAAALACQLALTEERWDERAPIKARMALHTGDVERREAKYFGAPLFRCSRLLSTAHGGQVVLSSTTADLVLESLPPGASFRDLGEHRVRDLIRPERIWQLIHPRIAADFAPLRSLTTLPNNLPAQLTTFIGRDREIEEIHRLLGTTRLMSLVGAGGSGKTRLAIQVGAELLHDYPEGVWLVELAPLTDPDLVIQAFARTVGVVESPAEPLAVSLLTHLREKRLLLILDNCEHLVASCARAVDSILRACPRIQILTTSREALGIPGEIHWRVPSLSVPSPRRALGAEQVSQFAAVRLFIDRAVAVSPSFAVTNRNAPAVAQICWRLDGIPLAIELAASRVRVLNVEQIAARLDDRFKLLTGGSRTALPRQQTLRALIDWSYDLLSDNERIVFRRLAVFSRGFTLDAAEAVGCEEPIDSYDVFELLTQLVEKSLVLTTDSGDETRYGMPESVRQYALDRLATSREHDPVQSRYVHSFVDLAETAAQGLVTGEREVWMARLERDYDNLRAVLVLCRNAQADALAGFEPSLMLRLAGSLCWFWAPRGIHAEGQTWVEASLSRASAEPTRELALALAGAGVIAGLLGQRTRSQERLADSVRTWREVGDRLNLARSLMTLSGVLGDSERQLQGVDPRHESTAIYIELNDPHALALSLRIAGILAFHLGDLANSRSLAEESVIVYRQLSNWWAIAECLNSLGDLARASGEFSQAISLYQETLVILRSHDLPGNVPSVLQNLAGLAIRRGDAREAGELYAEALATFKLRDDQRGVAECLGGMAAVCVASGRYGTPARLFGTAEAAFAVAGAQMWPANRVDYDANKEAARQALSEPAFAEDYTAGQALLLEQAISLALVEGTATPDSGQSVVRVGAGH